MSEEKREQGKKDAKTEEQAESMVDSLLKWQSLFTRTKNDTFYNFSKVLQEDEKKKFEFDLEATITKFVCGMDSKRKSTMLNDFEYQVMYPFGKYVFHEITRLNAYLCFKEWAEIIPRMNLKRAFTCYKLSEQDDRINKFLSTEACECYLDVWFETQTCKQSMTQVSLDDIQNHPGHYYVHFEPDVVNFAGRVEYIHKSGIHISHMLPL